MKCSKVDKIQAKEGWSSVNLILLVLQKLWPAMIGGQLAEVAGFTGFTINHILKLIISNTVQ
jgi:hypothetical protein